MTLYKDLFLQIELKSAKSSKLRKAFDLRDSEDKNSQRILNVLLPGTKTAIHRHQDLSEVVLYIYGSAIERFYYEEGNETKVVVIEERSIPPKSLLR